MDPMSREHLPPQIQKALTVATASGAGGRPEYGVLGEALSHIEVVLEDLQGLPPVLGQPKAVTDGYRIYLDHTVEHQGAEAVAGLLLKASGLLIAVQSGDALLSSHVALVNPDQFGAEQPWHEGDKTVPCLLETLAPVYGSGPDLLFQVVRQNRRANELLELAPAPSGLGPKF